MRPFSIRHYPNMMQLGLIIAAVLASISAGAAYLFYGSPFSPLLVAGLVLGIFIAMTSIRSPVFALYIALLVVFLPIGLIPASIQSNLNRLLAVVALVVWGVNLIVRQRRIVWTIPGLIMLGFIIWCLVTLIWVQNLEAAKFILGGYALRFILFLSLIPNEINSRDTFDGLMYTLALAGWVFIISGIVTIFTQGYTFGTRLQILEANENTIGGLFPIFAVGVIWLAIRTPNPRRVVWIFFSLAFFMLSFVLISLSGSRGSAITWAITILGLLFWRSTRVWGIFGLLILIAAIIIAPFILSTTIERFVERAGDTLLGGREALWQAAWQLIRDHPLTAVGIGNSPYAMMSIIRSFRSVGGYDRVSIHNPILVIWAETGLAGLLLYMGVLLSSVWSFIRQWIYCKKNDVGWLMPYFALTASAILGYFASWIKGGGMENSHSYFIMLALLLIPSHLENSSFQNLILPKDLINNPQNVP